jgi:hypothetical protein
MQGGLLPGEKAQADLIHHFQGNLLASEEDSTAENTTLMGPGYDEMSFS